MGEAVNPCGVGPFPGRSAALLQWCAADPGSFQARSLERSRLCGAPFRKAREDGRKRPNELHAAPRPGHPPPGHPAVI